MYADYLKEREGIETLSKPFGFISYKIVGEECYLANVYIKPEFRSKNMFSLLLGDLEVIAKKAGCKDISTNVHVQDSRCSLNVKIALKFDFNIIKADHNIIVMVKGI